MVSSEIQQKTTFLEKMKNQVTFGHLLSIMAIFVLPFAIWVKNVEVRFEIPLQNQKDILQIISEEKDIRNDMKIFQEKQNDHYIKILNEITLLRVDMQNKQNRK